MMRKMTEILITDDRCWMCGKTEKSVTLTKHHVLPKHFKPKHNALVPLCEPCHIKITADDIAGLYAYSYKLEKLLESLLGQVKGIKTAVENSIKIKFK